MPRLSLRTRVAIASSVAAAGVVAAFTVLTSVVLANNDAAQLDRRLDSIVEASMFPEQLSDPRRGVLTTGRSRSTGQVVFQRGFQLPALPPGTETVEVNGIEYRVRTIPMTQQGGGILLSLGIRADSILLNRARIPIYISVGVLTVLVAGGFGWLLAGPAVRPLRRLTEQTKSLDSGGVPNVKGAREAEELSDAMAGMLTRLAAAQQATTRSLQAAQDFAANAAHELRTPLTAMRADLDTLRIHDLPVEERDEVVADLLRAQRRVEATITALGQLASGQLARAEDRELIDVTDLLYRVAQENAGTTVGNDAPVAIEVVAAEDLGSVWGWPGGLRLAVDNLVRNAATHGGATRIVLAGARPAAGQVRIVVDDNGRGLPAEERAVVLERFSRGSTAVPGGSGLGLALVTQQAALHGGSLELDDSPLGGLRAVLTIVESAPEGSDGEDAPVSDAPPPSRWRASLAAVRRSSESPPR